MSVMGRSGGAEVSESYSGTETKRRKMGVSPAIGGTGMTALAPVMETSLTASHRPPLESGETTSSLLHDVKQISNDVMNLAREKNVVVIVAIPLASAADNTQ